MRVSRTQFQTKIAFQKLVCLTGEVHRNKPMTFGFDLIVYFGYSNIDTFYMKKSHLNTSKSNQFALSRIHVNTVCRIHLICCNFAALLCRCLRIFTFIEEVDLTDFAKLMLEITIISFTYMSPLGCMSNKDKDEPQVYENSEIVHLQPNKSKETSEGRKVA